MIEGSTFIVRRRMRSQGLGFGFERQPQNHMRLVQILARRPEPEPKIKGLGGIPVDDFERHRFAEAHAPLAQVLDQPRADASAADAGDQMQLAQMQSADEFVDLYPADILASDANDSRVCIFVGAPEAADDPPCVPPSDLFQMLRRAVEKKGERKRIIVLFCRPQREFRRDPGLARHAPRCAPGRFDFGRPHVILSQLILPKAWPKSCWWRDAALR